MHIKMISSWPLPNNIDTSTFIGHLTRAAFTSKVKAFCVPAKENFTFKKHYCKDMMEWLCMTALKKELCREHTGFAENKRTPIVRSGTEMLWKKKRGIRLKKMRNTLQGHSDFMNKIEIVGGPYHIETSQLICRANQRTSFYMIDLHH